jgi:hypothetical protein
MQDSLSFLAAVVISAVLLFVVPLQMSVDRQTHFSQFHIEQHVVRFVDYVCQKGFISPSMYIELQSKLLPINGKNIKIEMKHVKTVYVPRKLNGGTITNEMSEFTAVEEEYYQTQIFEQLFPSKKNDDGTLPLYYMNVGESFEVSVSSDDPSPQTYFSYGALIKNEAH